MTESKSGMMDQLETTLEEYLVKKAPFQLPANAKEAIVKFGPWVVLILMILSLPVIFAALGISALFSPFAMMGGANMFWIVPALISVVALVCNVIALPGLFNRTMKGWRYSYYAQLLSVISSLLYGNIASAILSGVIGLYILFQVKDKYK